MEHTYLFGVGVLAPLAGVIGLLAAGILYQIVLKASSGTNKMKAIGDEIHTGAMTFLKAEYSILMIFVLVVAILLSFKFNFYTALAFISGAVASGLAGWLGMKAATKANTRTTAAAKEQGQAASLLIAFQGGGVMGLSVASLGLLGLGILFYFFGHDLETVSVISGFSMGASSIALFSVWVGYFH